MESIAVSVQNVSKKFRLFNSPKERLLEAFHPFKKKYHREFWALKNISFDVLRGTTVGIIGRNASGKSTLLQIICSVIRPTNGSITTNGKISTLLELGADFNQEFTGRENVMIKGIRMGFSKTEMQKRLLMIEAFADIKEFIDQPVKIYSSGMFVRLAFATAIHIDPDILVIDEVLAVGDAKFQHKCYQKFLEFQEAGKTIIFVTHDTSAIVKHCNYALLLENGVILQAGNPKNVVNNYLELLFTEGVEKSSLVPELIKEGHRGFNIINYQKKYYALSQTLGSVDLAQVKESELRQLQESVMCFIGSSAGEVKYFIDELFSQNSGSHNKSEQSELEKFLEYVPATDNCIHRNSYNKNEVRFGDKRAEIVDYFVVCGEDYDPVIFRSGDLVDIYLRAIFHQTVELPMFGFSIKSIDGVVVYASNTRFNKTVIRYAKESDIIVIRFQIKMNLKEGDYFIDLGVAEKLPEKDKLNDVRYDIIHLIVQPKDYLFDGFVDMEFNFQEVSRIE